MRFIVRTCEGFLTERSGHGGATAPGISYVVLDSLINYRRVAEYRSEDYRHAPGYSGSPSRAEARRLAREAAETKAAQLERLVAVKEAVQNGTRVPRGLDWHKPQPEPKREHNFRPTCPSCLIVCQAGARYCVECGTRLYPTDGELAAMVDELRTHG